MLAALVIAAALSVGGCAGLAALGRSPGGVPRGAPVPAGLGAADLPPALVSLVLSECAPGTEAYEATILDLAARGFLAASAGSAGWQIALPAPAEPATGQAGSELASFGQASTEHSAVRAPADQPDRVTRRLPSRSTAAVKPGCSGTVAPYSSMTAGPASVSPAARRGRQ